MTQPVSIRAAVTRVFGEPLVLETVRLAAPGPREVRVRLEAVAICHSDLLYAEGAWGGDLPAVWGHEAAGVVDSVGPDVTDVAEGSRVVVTLIRSCGVCAACAQGHTVSCSATFALDERSPLTDSSGTPLNHGMRTGAFAEMVVVHHSQVATLPDDIGAAPGALLACGVMTGVGAVHNTAEVGAGETVVVVGAGGVGINVVQGARIAGAAEIIAVDIEDTQLAAALAFGATAVCNSRSADVAALVANRTGGRMADCVLVAAGVKAAFETGLPLVAASGAFVIVGMPPSGVTLEVDPGTVAGNNQRILGSKMGGSIVARDIPRLIEWYRSGDLELDGLISGIHPFTEIERAMDAARAGGSLRQLVVFDEDPA